MAWEGSTRRSTLSRDWPVRRRRVLRRDPLCVLCEQRPSTEVDHIGDRHDHSEANLRGLCTPCHQGRSGRQGGQAGGQARAARAASRFRPVEPHPGMK